MRWHGLVVGWLVAVAVSLTIALGFNLNGASAFWLGVLVAVPCISFGMALDR